MKIKIFFVFFSITAMLAGCISGRIVASANVQDLGDKVSTKYRYKIVFEEKDYYGDTLGEKLQSYQPNVFSNDGVPIVITNKTVLRKKSGGPDSLLGLISVCTYNLFPYSETVHSHKSQTISIGAKEITSAQVCITKKEWWSFMPIVSRILVLCDNGESCFSKSKGFSVSYNLESKSIAVNDIYKEVLAYGIASKLKEAEESGLIDGNLVAKARVGVAMTDILSTVQKIIDDDAARRGVSVSADKSNQESPFEIIRCEPDQGKDFSYAFSLRRKGGGAITFSDFSVVRSVFRSAIRTHYSSLHPDINPRTLEIDFTDYSLKAGIVSGRVIVLSISSESLSYDSRTRKGAIRVRIRDGQLEAARRWIRCNLGDLARKSNVDVVGDAIPKNGRFFSEREEMRDGVLEVLFSIE